MDVGYALRLDAAGSSIADDRRVDSLTPALSFAMTMAAVGRTLVMPLDDLSPRETYRWVGEGFAEALSSHLQCSGQEIVGLAELHSHLSGKGLSPGAPLTRATVIVIGRELGATRAVVGSYRVDEGLAHATAKIIDLEKGAIVGVIEDHGEMGNLLDLENRFAKNLFRLEGDPVPESFEKTAARRRRLSLEAHEKVARARREQDSAARQALLESALDMDPEYLEARLLLGRVLLREEEPVEAIRLLSAFQPQDFVYREAYFLLGLAYLAANQTAAATEIFSHLTDQENKASFWNNLGIASLRMGDMEKAIEAFGRAVEIEPDDSLYLFNLGWAYWRAGKGGETLHWVREAARREPEDAEAHLLLSAATASRALPEESAKERELALALSPELADVDLSTAEGLERIAQTLPRLSGGSAESWETAAERVRETLDRARAHRADGRLDEAVRELQRALYVQPHWAEARLELAEIYREAGELSRAVGEYRVALWDEESASIHVRLAEVYLEMGDSVEARAHAERALELEPESGEANDVLEKLKNTQP